MTGAKCRKEAVAQLCVCVCECVLVACVYPRINPLSSSSVAVGRAW